MKKTYKYIIASVVFSAASLLSGLNLNAQNLPAGVYLEEDGICFRKSAKQNPDGKTYTIDLESFVKGKISYTESADPSDIVLVLDVSGSMNDNLTYYTYNKASNPIIMGRDLYYYGWYSSRETNYYYKIGEGPNAEYCQVYVGMDGSGNDLSGYHFFIYFQDSNGKRWHINSAGELVDIEPTDVPGTNYDTNLVNSNVTLYTRQQGTKTKLAALKEAVYAFITEVAKNAKYDKKGQLRPTPLDHRIAIVKFASIDGNGYNYSYYNNNADAFEEAGSGSELGNHIKTVPTNISASGFVNYTEVVRGLKSVLTDSTNLKKAIEGLAAGGATASDYGMHLAKNIIDKIDRTSNKTVVFFTDGDPNHYNGFNDDVADDAINNSHAIKSITYGSEENATHPIVFSVGVFNGSEDSRTEDYMEYISSNYPDATSMVNHGNRESGADFNKDASGGAADLTAIFKAIAGSAASQGSTIGSSSAVTVDVVTNSFSVPVGYEDHPENAITVLVAPCEGTTKIEYNGQVKDYLVFGEAKTPEEYGLAPIKPAISEADNKVTTTGFDYSANFCGPDESGSTTTYRGYKQIIRFTITLKDEAVGGPNVATNDPTSGIYVDGEKKATFNRPTVKIPVQIWIQKTGLKEDDSAVFTLYATPYVEGQKEEVYRSDDYKNKWKTFTKVIVNSENMVEIDDPNNPGQKVKVVKLVGLDPDYYYRLKEDAWAFGYQYQTSNGIVDTIGDEIKNPILIENSPKDIVFDEAVYRNVFKERKSDTQE